MNVQEFLAESDTLDTKCRQVFEVANREYATSHNQFANFETIATVLALINPTLAGIRPQDVAMVFALKHLISIGKGISIREDMQGRYVDILNYIKLHYAMSLESQV